MASPRHRYDSDEYESFREDVRHDSHSADIPSFRSDLKCPECGEPCSPKECDDGLGPIEFWGAKSFDSRPYWGSDCCEADIGDQEL